MGPGVQHVIGKLRSLFRSAAVLVVVIAALAACGSADDQDDIRLQANAVGGGQLYYEDLASQDTVLWFWAPW